MVPERKLSAVAAGLAAVGACSIIGLLVPGAAAAPAAPVAIQQQGPETGDGPVDRAPPSYPDRWHVAYFVAEDDDAGTDCQTIVVIRNLTRGDVGYGVEFQEEGGMSADVYGEVGAADVMDVVASGPSDHSYPPLALDLWADRTSSEGVVTVSAEDPRIFVSAYFLCTVGGSATITSIAPVPATPVGATLDLFEADGLRQPARSPLGGWPDDED